MMSQEDADLMMLGIKPRNWRFPPSMATPIADCVKGKIGLARYNDLTSGRQLAIPAEKQTLEFCIMDYGAGIR